MYMQSIRVKCFCLSVLCGVSLCFSVHAQVFSSDDEDSSQNDQVETVSSSTSGWNKFYGNSSPKSQAGKLSGWGNYGKDIDEQGSNTYKSVPPEKEVVTDPQDYIYKDVPQVDRPTLDGVERGRTSVIQILEKPGDRPDSEGYIYLFYSDFSVGSLMSGTTTCDVKFQILTTLDRKLNSLAVRLKWPELETPLTFMDVNPNQVYHMAYTLLGDGCYSMDKIPNIVINRCRIKGMSQQDCAKRVRWIRKM